ARFSSRTTSSGNPLRCRPTVLRPYSFTGLPTAFTYGGTSLATREQPPMKLYLPISANWCTADTPDRIAFSSTVTWPASWVAFENRVRRDGAVVGDDASVADDRERSDLDVRAQLRIPRDDRRRMNVGAHRSRTIAPISASHTISPSTFATPFIRAIVPRTCIRSSSKRT